jgi:hypothetical protein
MSDNNIIRMLPLVASPLTSDSFVHAVYGRLYTQVHGSIGQDVLLSYVNRVVGVNRFLPVCREIVEAGPPWSRLPSLMAEIHAAPPPPIDDIVSALAGVHGGWLHDDSTTAASDDDIARINNAVYSLSPGHLDLAFALYLLVVRQWNCTETVFVRALNALLPEDPNGTDIRVSAAVLSFACWIMHDALDDESTFTTNSNRNVGLTRIVGYRRFLPIASVPVAIVGRKLMNLLNTVPVAHSSLKTKINAFIAAMVARRNDWTHVDGQARHPRTDKIKRFTFNPYAPTVSRATNDVDRMRSYADALARSGDVAALAALTASVPGDATSATRPAAPEWFARAMTLNPFWPSPPPPPTDQETPANNNPFFSNSFFSYCHRLVTDDPSYGALRRAFAKHADDATDFYLSALVLTVGAARMSPTLLRSELTRLWNSLSPTVRVERATSFIIVALVKNKPGVFDHDDTLAEVVVDAGVIVEAEPDVVRRTAALTLLKATPNEFRAMLRLVSEDIAPRLHRAFERRAPTVADALFALGDESLSPPSSDDTNATSESSSHKRKEPSSTPMAMVALPTTTTTDTVIALNDAITALLTDANDHHPQ